LPHSNPATWPLGPPGRAAEGPVSIASMKKLILLALLVTLGVVAAKRLRST
jgi:hypothetical protein